MAKYSSPCWQLALAICSMVKVLSSVFSEALGNLRFPSGHALAPLVFDSILIDPDPLLEPLVSGGPGLNVKSLLEAICFPLLKSIFKEKSQVLVCYLKLSPFK